MRPNHSLRAASFGGDCAANGSITLAPGDVNSSTITNNDVAPRLTVTKIVFNNNGGTKTVADFPLFVDATKLGPGGHPAQQPDNPGPRLRSGQQRLEFRDDPRGNAGRLLLPPRASRRDRRSRRNQRVEQHDEQGHPDYALICSGSRDITAGASPWTIANGTAAAQPSC